MSLLDFVKHCTVLKSKPYALTLKEWRQFHTDSKKDQPLAYFLNITMPRQWNRYYNKIISPFVWMHTQITCRFFDRCHIVKTNLKPGYYDINTRILHSNFTLLVDYVEIECNKNYFNRQKSAWWTGNLLTKLLVKLAFKSERSSEAGLNYLKWEMTLDSDNLSQYEKSNEQAEKARVVWELYHWWKYIRPMRPDPYVISGWQAHNGKNIFDEFTKTKGLTDTERNIMQTTEYIENYFRDEDTKMLIKLIKIKDLM